MMYRKICNIALLVTSFFVFITWTLTNEISISHDYNGMFSQIIIFVINFASAFGFFRIFVSLTIYILERLKIAKKAIFASSFFEGRWVGYYVSPENNKPIVFFQIIEQSIDVVHILSEDYNVDDSNSYRGVWKSEGDVSIASKKSSLSYLYNFDSTTPNSVTFGMFNATFHKKGILSIPCIINGHAFNLHSKTKFRVQQIKVSDSIVMGGNDKKNFYKKP